MRLLQDLVKILCGLCLLIRKALDLLINGRAGGFSVLLYRVNLLAKFLNRAKQLVIAILFHVGYLLVKL